MMYKVGWADVAAVIAFFAAWWVMWKLVQPYSPFGGPAFWAVKLIVSVAVGYTTRRIALQAGRRV